MDMSGDIFFPVSGHSKKSIYSRLILWVFPIDFFECLHSPEKKCLHSCLLVYTGIDLLSDGDYVSIDVNLFANLGTPAKTCLIYGVLHGVLRRCLKTVYQRLKTGQDDLRLLKMGKDVFR